jgi:hypothetical protein
MVVVVLNVCLRDAFEVASVHDQKSVEAFAAAGRRPTKSDGRSFVNRRECAPPSASRARPPRSPRAPSFALNYTCVPLGGADTKWHTHGTRSRLREEIWLNHAPSNGGDHYS